MEPLFRKEYTMEAIHVDRFGRAKPSVLLYLTQEAATLHSRLLGTDWDTLNKKHLFWAVIRHRLQVTRLPMEGETITVETWPMPTTRVAYPRSTVAYDQQGNELFRSIALWVLMDTDSRAMILPGKSGVAVAGTIRGNELAAPGSIVPKVLENTLSRQVCYMDLDRNGHMNNTKYLDWICDLLPSEFHKDHPLRECTLCYLSEAREGQLLELTWELPQPDTLQVDAHWEKTDVPAGQERVFAAQLLF